MAWAILSILFLGLLWFVALWLGLPIWLPIAVTAALALAWAFLLVWRRLQARRAAGQIEKALQSQADAQTQGARPDQQAEIQGMQGEFQKAVAALKSSKLARGGRDALAVLPWYLIIGPPGSGKSTALRASGLKFPYLTGRGGVRGVGGTRNCEWWLTNEAVILDTAGRYSTEEEDHAEWTAFLDTLKKARPRKPVNGLIVGVSVSDLGAESEEGAAALGQRMRERVDEVLERLQVVLPVYVLFTKCDLVPGFVETFGDLRKNERGQVWGFTVPVGDAREKGELFGEMFGELLATCEERALARMASERQQAARERIYGFPQQLDSLRANLAAFVSTLFTESVYQDAPILRGVYFTSGTQEGRTIDRVMSSMAEAFGVRPRAQAPEPVVEAKSYFLRDVFAKVLFPDQHIAVMSADALKRERIRRWVILGVAAAVALFVFTLPLRAFLLNRELVQSTGAIVDAVAAKLKATSGGAPPIDDIEPLRARLADLVERSESGAPLGMRFGMYQGDALLPHVRKFHAQAVRRLVLDPVFRQGVGEMEEFLRRFEATEQAPSAAEHARFYDELKMHLLVTAPRGLGEPRIDEPLAAWLGARVAARWQRRWSAAAAPASAERLAANASLYAKVLSADPTFALPRYEDLVRRVRRVLARVPMSMLAVERLAGEVDAKGYEVTLATVLGGPVPSLRSAEKVRGAFTRKGYDELKPRLDDPSGILELWVLASDPKELEAVQAREFERLRTRYFGEYIEEWTRFVESIAPAASPGSAGALSLLQDLTRGEPPPYARVFRAVGYNTRIAGAAGAAAAAAAGIVEKLMAKMPGQRKQAVEAALRVDREEAVIGPSDVQNAFAGLVAFGYAGDSAAAEAGAPAAKRTLPIDDYQEQLVFVRDALQTALESSDAAPLVGRVGAARTRIRSLVDAQPIGWRPTLERLLWPPIEAASSTSAREAAAGASVKWCSSVALPWKRNLAARYPFNRNGHDAALADVAEFFRPGSGLVWGCYNEALRSEIQRSGDDFKFQRQLGGATGFNPAVLTFLAKTQEITTVLFPAGSNDPSVPFTVRIRPTPNVASVVLEVDGQRFEYLNGPEEWRKMTWPATGKTAGALLRVRGANGREETLQQDGEWGFFRLLDAGQLKGEPGVRDFTMSFGFPGLGVNVVVDFRPARSEAPFFGIQRGGKGRLFAPFRSGLTAPLVIGKGSPPCH